MIATIYIDTINERLFPLAGDSYDAVTEFVKNQIDLSFVTMCTPATIRHLHPGLTSQQVEIVLSLLLMIPSERRESLGAFEVCADEIYLYLRSNKKFVVSGWSAVFRRTPLPASHKRKKVVHSFGALIEKEFQNVCQAVAQKASRKKSPDTLS